MCRSISDVLARGNRERRNGGRLREQDHVVEGVLATVWGAAKCSSSTRPRSRHSYSAAIVRLFETLPPALTITGTDLPVEI